MHLFLSWAIHGGLELANAFSELTDVDEQVMRFEKERERRRQMGKEDYPLPGRLIKALHNMLDPACLAFGIDRFVMLFANNNKYEGQSYTFDRIIVFVKCVALTPLISQNNACTLFYATSLII
jgi:hypothetical protein